MTKKELKIMEMGIQTVQAIMKMARKPIVTRRGNLLLSEYIDKCKNMKDSKPEKKEK